MEKSLFKPLAVGRFQLEHRIVLAPLTRSRGTERDSDGNESLANELMVTYFDCNKNQNQLNRKQATYYAQRTTQGGLLISEASPICPEGRFSILTPSLYSSEHIRQWNATTTAVHEKGGFIFAQLWHLGMHSRPHLDPLNRSPAAPSEFNRESDGTPTRALTLQEISDTINLYVQAAKNAIEAGFDGVEIHGANGYLVDQFLNDNINKRSDSYGSTTLENKCRFATQVTKAVADAIGADRTGIRLSPWNKFGGMNDSDPIKTWSYLLESLNPLGLAYVHLVEPRVAGAGDSSVEFDAKVVNLSEFRKVWKGVLIVAGGYLPDSAENAVDKGRADLVAFGRYFISNPDLVYRIKEGLPFTKYDRPTFQVGGETGYIDYKTWAEGRKQGE
ncbi:UNVERIFIED_CONTAM: hypothetical protein HDU68_000481 [Siphonaria sp. JEL0065]|nr:hypothetical protein HDU68_000481 [Siphonaria sp. JEL0065]